MDCGKRLVARRLRACVSRKTRGDAQRSPRRGIPVLRIPAAKAAAPQVALQPEERRLLRLESDRKSTRLNSSHQIISYAVFCFKKKKNRLPLLPPTSTRHLS